MAKGFKFTDRTITRMIDSLKEMEALVNEIQGGVYIRRQKGTLDRVKEDLARTCVFIEDHKGG